MHHLVEMQHLTRTEFLRGLEGVSDEDARRRVEPMNCISWIIGHVAWQEFAFFTDWIHDAGRERYRPYPTGSPASQPPLEEVMELWNSACEGANELLHIADEESLRQPIMDLGPDTEQEVLGTLIVRNIFHYWSHIGEISAIRQMLGHPNQPQFVDMHGWQYGMSQPGPSAGRE